MGNENCWSFLLIGIYFETIGENSIFVTCIEQKIAVLTIFSFLGGSQWKSWSISIFPFSFKQSSTSSSRNAVEFISMPVSQLRIKLCSYLDANKVGCFWSWEIFPHCVQIVPCAISLTKNNVIIWILTTTFLHTEKSHLAVFFF